MKYKYFRHKASWEYPANSGQYEMLNCGCYRQPITEGRIHLAKVRCKHHGWTMSTGILETARDENGLPVIDNCDCNEDCNTDPRTLFPCLCECHYETAVIK